MTDLQPFYQYHAPGAVFFLTEEEVVDRRARFALGYNARGANIIRTETASFHASRPRTTPIRLWSYAARVMLATGLMALLLHVPAWALSGPELDRLVPIIIAAESSGNPNVVGDGGRARGLMQIQKATWEHFSEYPWRDAFDPEKNVQVGREILEHIDFCYAATWNKNTSRARIIYTYNTGIYCFEKHLPR